MTRHLLTLLSLFFAFQSNASTFHTINIDGTNDFSPDETFAGTPTSTWYFTWDANNFYFGIDASDVGSNDASKWVQLYIDTDPSTPITGGTGSNTGVNYNTQMPDLPFSANYHLRWKADNSYTNMLDYNDGTNNWADDNTNSGNFGINAFQSGNFVEFSIPKASLGSPSNIHVSGSMINEQGGGEFTFFMFPSNNTANYDANHDHFYGFPISKSLFSPNTGSNLDNNLPVELTSFTAKPNKNKVDLSWQTAQEINNDFFQIERKVINSQIWDTIGKKQGAGDSDEEIRYNFTDTKPVNGINFYRLKQTDFDGQFEYSEMVSAEIRNAISIDIFPNPTASELTIITPLDFTEGEIRLFDTSGRLVISTSVNERNYLNLSDLSSGIYFFRLLDKNGNVVAEDKVRKL
ncbi:MAG: hypothetical protein ACI85O_001586 [Saprospiraceae bacterium]|jgi:hypothetical protein